MPVTLNISTSNTLSDAFSIRPLCFTDKSVSPSRVHAPKIARFSLSIGPVMAIASLLSSGRILLLFFNKTLHSRASSLPYQDVPLYHTPYSLGKVS